MGFWAAVLCLALGASTYAAVDRIRLLARRRAAKRKAQAICDGAPTDVANVHQAVRDLGGEFTFNERPGEEYPFTARVTLRTRYGESSCTSTQQTATEAARSALRVAMPSEWLSCPCCHREYGAN